MATLLAPGSNKAKIKADLAQKKLDIDRKHHRFKLGLYASLLLNILLLIKLVY